MRKEKWLILGHGGHGKDTFADILNDLSGGISFSSSSVAAMQAIWPALKVVLGYKDGEQEKAFNDRGYHRELWKTLISLYNTPDKTALCRKILENADLYVGMRCKEEFRECKGLFDRIFWVDASQRLPKEESMTIDFDPYCMVYVDNNLEIDYLKQRAEELLIHVRNNKVPNTRLPYQA